MEEITNKKLFSRDEFGALSFWAWNSKMEDEDIYHSITEMYEQGYRGFFMHSRAGLLTPYLSDDWFHACRTAVEYAKKFHMEAWIYDEDGWPSGFAGGRVNSIGEDFRAKYIDIKKAIIPNGDKYLLACFSKKDNSYEISNINNADTFFYYCIEPNYVDLLSSEVTKAFIDSTYERYKQELGQFFGDTIKGFFTDEPQYLAHGLPYSHEMPAYFENRNGISFTNNQYLLLIDTLESNHFRIMYWETVEEMMRINFSKQLFDWCEANGVMLTGHYPGEDSLVQQINSTAGVMPKYEYMQVPGIDHLGRRIAPILLTKQVTSAAKQLGRERVLSETCGCTGWNVTFDQICHIWGWQAMTGINKPCIHLGAQSIIGIRKRDYPAFFSYQAPWWSHFHHVTEWMSGLNYKMYMGKWLEDVLVISPIQSVYMAHREKRTPDEEAIGSQFRTLLENLIDIQVGFDIGDETLLQHHGCIKDGKLIVGKCSYRIVILPVGYCLKESTWLLIDQFVAEGGLLIYTQNKIRRLNSDTVKGAVVQNRRSFWYKHFAAIGYERPATVFDSDGFSIATGLALSVKKDGTLLRIYIWNHMTNAKRSFTFRISGEMALYSVDIKTDAKQQLSTWMDKTYTYTNITLIGYQSLLLEAEPGKKYISTCKAITTKRLDGTISLANLNSLTLDYAAYSFNGNSYSEVMPIIKLQEHIYDENEYQKSQSVRVRYKFRSELTKTDTLSACVESASCVDIICNGASIIHSQDGWYVDKGIIKYPIGNFAKHGENELIVIYHVPQTDVRHVDGLFETEVNRFFYPLEPESIYITGNFDVSVKGEIYRKLTHLSVNAKCFVLKDSRVKQRLSTLTEDGLWFYRGDVVFNTSIEKINGLSVIVHVESPKCALISIRSNSQERVIFLSPFEADITTMLNNGVNDIDFVLHGTNRNLLGPHHHISGENNFVGPNTFKGRRGYEDHIVNPDIQTNDTWTDSYSFVDFGCEGIYVSYRISDD